MEGIMDKLAKTIHELTFRRSVKKRVAYSQKKYEQGNVMYYFAVLNGIHYLKVALTNGEEHDYRMVIDEIHNYQEKHPYKKVKEGYMAALSKTISAIKAKRAIALVLKYIHYDLEKRRNCTSSFRLDFEVLYEELKAKVNEKIDDFRDEDPDFDKWIKREFDLLEKKIALDKRLRNPELY